MNESSGYNPLNCNPHHELLASVKHSLAECSSGDRALLFETRERLHDLTGRIEQGPWSMLASLTGTVEMILGHLLRRGSLDGPELMQVATETISFVDRALTLAPPQGSATASPTRAPRIALDGPAPAGELKFVRPSLRHEPLQAVDGELVAGMAEAGSYRGENPELELARAGKRSAADFGNVAYQMVNESRLGELLIKMGRLQPDQLDRALVLQKLSRKRLGDVLMAMEAVDLRALQSALEVQRQETLRFMDGRTDTRPDDEQPFERAS